MEPAIVVRHLSKSFRVYARPRDFLIEFVARRPRHHVFPALTDVSFEVQPGEIVGILGRNGAGKSTLLKLLARTLEPSSGSSSVRGRVSAILELGTGFHPDYSGRENAVLGAICLGMSRREARERLDSIVAFAELDDFIDRPFRTYSSGMQARLTFATAVAATPEVLIIDEALAVGDARFQLRCFDRIREMRDAGCTILFVSHSIEQVTALCTRAALLEKGRLLEFDEPAKVTRAYHKLLFGNPGRAVATFPHSVAKDDSRSMGTREWQIISHEVLVLNSDGSRSRASSLRARQRYELRFMARGETRIDDLCGSFMIRNQQGIVVCASDSLLMTGAPHPVRPDRTVEYIFQFTCHLGGGRFGSRYFLTFGIGHANGTKIDFRYDALELLVEGVKTIYDTSLCDLEIVLECNDIPSSEDANTTPAT